MKTLCNILLYWLKGLSDYGFLFIVAHIIPVSFKQDEQFINKGKDILSIKKHQGYYTGLFRSNPYYK